MIEVGLLVLLRQRSNVVMTMQEVIMSWVMLHVIYVAEGPRIHAADTHVSSIALQDLHSIRCASDLAR